MTAKDIDDHLHVAAFLATVNDSKQAKSYWEKKTNKNTLADYIRSTSEAEKEMSAATTTTTWQGEIRDRKKTNSQGRTCREDRKGQTPGQKEQILQTPKTPQNPLLPMHRAGLDLRTQ